MRFDRTEKIAGQPILRVRDFLRWVGSDSFHSEHVMERFGINELKAQEVIVEMLSRGWVGPKEQRQDRGPRYGVTNAGSALCAARAVSRLPHAKAERIFLAFMERVADVNSRGELTHYVESVGLFGSFIDPKAEDHGDIDICLDLRQRPVPGRDIVNHSVESARLSGRRLGFIDRITYGEVEVRRLLKARSPYLSFHEPSELEQMGAVPKLAFLAQPGSVALRPARTPKAKG